jgi:hypothetical protein
MAEKGGIFHDTISRSGPPRESAGPLYSRPRSPSMVQGSHASKPDPLGEVQTPLSGVWATHNEVPGQGIPWPKQGSGTNTCLGFILCACAPRSSGNPMLSRGLLPVT